MPDFSVFDLVPITQGSTPEIALHHALELAQKAEAWGYKRYWVAEHHNMPGIASAATSVVIGYIAGGTKTIRVGSGGVMLPNHSPLVIAEQFGTLETLYPGRIDLGLGRAPGTDQQTLRALKRDPISSDQFPQDVLKLQELLGPANPGYPVKAVPGMGTHVPLWILGSSLFGAQLAAQLGLPYSFAAHFAPKLLLEALAIYRAQFQPSVQLKEPRAMACVNVIAAETDGKPGSFSPRPSKASPISSGEKEASFLAPSTISKAIGRRWKKSILRNGLPVPLWVRQRPSKRD